MIRTGQVPEHTEYSGLARNNKTLSAQDWAITKTHHAQDWLNVKRHRVHKTGQVPKHTKCSELDKYLNT